MTVVIKEIRYVVCESCVEAVVEDGFCTDPGLDDEDCEIDAAEFARVFWWGPARPPVRRYRR